jgi:hypothetical protein
MKNDLTASYVRELFEYDTKTGNLIWKSSRGNSSAGSVAGCDTGNGYIAVTVDSARYKAHRLVWLHHYGEWPDGPLDHINGVSSDNRLSNLRLVTQAINLRNQKLSTHNSSGVCGVGWMKALEKWAAYITVNRCRKHLGYFANKEDAIVARKQAEFAYGFHPNHGKTEEKRALTI